MRFFETSQSCRILNFLCRVQIFDFQTYLVQKKIFLQYYGYIGGCPAADRKKIVGGGGGGENFGDFSKIKKKAFGELFSMQIIKKAKQ